MNTVVLLTGKKTPGGAGKPGHTRDTRGTQTHGTNLTSIPHKHPGPQTHTAQPRRSRPSPEPTEPAEPTEPPWSFELELSRKGIFLFLFSLTAQRFLLFDREDRSHFSASSTARPLKTCPTCPCTAIRSRSTRRTSHTGEHESTRAARIGDQRGTNASLYPEHAPPPNLLVRHPRILWQ